MRVLLATSDLATSSKVTAAATRQGMSLDVAMSVAATLEKVAETPRSLVIVDLGLPGLETRDLVTRLRALAPPPGAILAFGPHVHAELLQAAAAAGCDQVMSRGQFHAQVDSILSGLAAMETRPQES